MEYHQLFLGVIFLKIKKIASILLSALVIASASSFNVSAWGSPEQTYEDSSDAMATFFKPGIQYIHCDMNVGDKYTYNCDHSYGFDSVEQSKGVTGSYTDNTITLFAFKPGIYKVSFKSTQWILFLKFENRVEYTVTVKERQYVKEVEQYDHINLDSAEARNFLGEYSNKNDLTIRSITSSSPSVADYYIPKNGQDAYLNCKNPGSSMIRIEWSDNSFSRFALQVKSKEKQKIDCGNTKTLSFKGAEVKKVQIRSGNSILVKNDKTSVSIIGDKIGKSVVTIDFSNHDSYTYVFDVVNSTKRSDYHTSFDKDTGYTWNSQQKIKNITCSNSKVASVSKTDHSYSIIHNNPGTCTVTIVLENGNKIIYDVDLI